MLTLDGMLIYRTVYLGGQPFLWPASEASRSAAQELLIVLFEFVKQWWLRHIPGERGLAPSWWGWAKACHRHAGTPGSRNERSK
jgi:hypothetical protein